MKNKNSSLMVYEETVDEYKKIALAISNSSENKTGNEIKWTRIANIALEDFLKRHTL